MLTRTSNPSRRFRNVMPRSEDSIGVWLIDAGTTVNVKSLPLDQVMTVANSRAMLICIGRRN